MKKLFFAAVAALAIVSVSNVFAGKAAGMNIVPSGVDTVVTSSTNSPSDTTTAKADTSATPADTAVAK